MSKQKALKVTISGTYHNSKKEVVDFEEVVGVIPFTTEEMVKFHGRKRYAARWIKETKDTDGKKVYKDSINRIRSFYVDNIEETEAEFSFIGKDIKAMNYEELQDLALLKDLRLIPVRKEDMRQARIRAYVDYSERVLNKVIEWRKDPDFEENFMKMPAIIVNDVEVRVETSGKITNEEIIDAEMNSTSTKDDPHARFTMAELKQLADEKGIKYAVNIGFDTLYNKLYT